MKKNLSRLAGFLIIAVGILAGCNKDDNAPKNQFTYEGTNYNLKTGFIENYGASTDVAYNTDLTFVSSEFTVHDASGEVDSISGTGHFVYFEIYSSSQTEIVPGTYTFDESESGNALTFDWGAFGMNTVAYGGTYKSLSAGTVIVKKSGTTYTITFDCTDSNTKKITGYFKGTLDYYDYNMGKKSASVKRFMN
jgi:hypothetical protein